LRTLDLKISGAQRQRKWVVNFGDHGQKSLIAKRVVSAETLLTAVLPILCGHNERVDVTRITGQRLDIRSSGYTIVHSTEFARAHGVCLIEVRAGLSHRVSHARQTFAGFLPSCVV